MRDYLQMPPDYRSRGPRGKIPAEGPQNFFLFPPPQIINGRPLRWTRVEISTVLFQVLLFCKAPSGPGEQCWGQISRSRSQSPGSKIQWPMSKFPLFINSGKVQKEGVFYLNNVKFYVRQLSLYCLVDEVLHEFQLNLFIFPIKSHFPTFFLFFPPTRVKM